MPHTSSQTFRRKLYKKLWTAADKLRSNLDAAVYKHAVLGLIFLNANFAWVQHMLHHLAPNGSMALLLANGSMSSNASGEGDIRRALIEADLVECMVALPRQLFICHKSL